MAELLTIGKLAGAAGVKRSTVRYYEQQGLIKPVKRSAHGYRQYDRASLEHLRFIRSAQTAGFSLSDIKSLQRFRGRTNPPCESVRDLIDGRLQDVEQQLKDLRHIQQVLRNARKQCAEGQAEQTCAVLDRLDAAASVSPED